MKRHQIHIFTNERGLTWASCSTCGAQSKQRTKHFAEEWMAEHQNWAMGPAGQSKRKAQKREWKRK